MCIKNSIYTYHKRHSRLSPPLSLTPQLGMCRASSMVEMGKCGKGVRGETNVCVFIFPFQFFLFHFLYVCTFKRRRRVVFFSTYFVPSSFAFLVVLYRSVRRVSFLLAFSFLRRCMCTRVFCFSLILFLYFSFDVFFPVGYALQSLCLPFLRNGSGAGGDGGCCLNFQNENARSRPRVWVWWCCFSNFFFLSHLLSLALAPRARSCVCLCIFFYYFSLKRKLNVPCLFSIPFLSYYAPMFNARFVIYIFFWLVPVCYFGSCKKEIFRTSTTTKTKFSVQYSGCVAVFCIIWIYCLMHWRLRCCFFCFILFGGDDDSAEAFRRWNMSKNNTQERRRRTKVAKMENDDDDYVPFTDNRKKNAKMTKNERDEKIWCWRWIFNSM